MELMITMGEKWGISNNMWQLKMRQLVERTLDAKADEVLE